MSQSVASSPLKVLLERVYEAGCSINECIIKKLSILHYFGLTRIQFSQVLTLHRTFHHSYKRQAMGYLSVTYNTIQQPSPLDKGAPSVA